MAIGVLDKMVDEQVRRWQIEQRRRSSQRDPLCLALSRLPCSGGEEYGERVAKALGWEFYGIELVDHIARQKHVHRQLVGALDEHMRTAIDRYMDAFRTRPFTESDYLREVARAVSALGERGGAVIVGRGAPFILGPHRALRVLIVGPREARVARLARQQGLDEEQAAEHLERLDRERHEFLAQFHADPDDPARFDLVLSPDTLGFELAVELTVRAARARLGRE